MKVFVYFTDKNLVKRKEIWRYEVNVLFTKHERKRPLEIRRTVCEDNIKNLNGIGCGLKSPGS
jgi:hypothetical protein